MASGDFREAGRLAFVPVAALRNSCASRAAIGCTNPRQRGSVSASSCVSGAAIRRTPFGSSPKSRAVVGEGSLFTYYDLLSRKTGICRSRRYHRLAARNHPGSGHADGLRRSPSATASCPAATPPIAAPLQLRLAARKPRRAASSQFSAQRLAHCGFDRWLGCGEPCSRGRGAHNFQRPNSYPAPQPSGIGERA